MIKIKVTLEMSFQCCVTPLLTEIVHPHLGAGFPKGLFGALVSVVLRPEFVGDPQVTARHSTVADDLS